MSAESDKALADVLKPEQTKRYKQISIQARGVDAFADEEVQKALKITEEQKTKLGELATELQAKRREIMQNAQGDFSFTRVRSIGTDSVASFFLIFSRAAFAGR